MQTPAAILERIRSLREVEGFAAAQAFLRDPQTHPHQGGTGGRVTVKQIDHAWRTRLEIARGKGVRPVPGCEHLVSELNKLPGETVLDTFIFEHEDGLGAFWFVEQTGEPVGFVVGERATASATSGK